MYTATGWKDYEVIDTGEGQKLERWGKFILLRPDPQVLWPNDKLLNGVKLDAKYIRSSEGGGQWEYFTRLPDKWTVAYKDLKFIVRPTGFKHTGLFPEQAANWDWMRGLLKSAGRPVSVLNLFGYTGGATVACAAEGASVCHVDAARAMVEQAKENIALSGLSESSVRYIVDDCITFVEREIKRGKRYDAIVMDPPSYGRGPRGEVWKLEKELFPLVALCAKVLSDKPLFFLINSYTTGLQPAVLTNIMQRALPKGTVEAGEIVLPVTAGGVLPCGASGRWYRTK